MDVAATTEPGIAVVDEALMLRYQSGDAAAFDELYARHRAPLFRLITRQLSARAEAEEVFQDVWMNVIQSRENYAVSALFRTWLYTLAHHRMMDYFRRHRRAEWVAFERGGSGEDDASAVSSETIPCTRSAQPEVQAQSRQQGAAILRVLALLPAVQREAFLLSEEAGFTVAEIAASTGVSVEAAKSRLRYALRRLRDGLQAYR